MFIFIFRLNRDTTLMTPLGTHGDQEEEELSHGEVQVGSSQTSPIRLGWPISHLFGLGWVVLASLTKHLFGWGGYGAKPCVVSLKL